MNESTPTLARERSRHPLWMRALAVCIVWTLELQPAFAASTLSQQPLFTVTSVPPNIMMMFDDSASMNQLTLNPPPGMETPTASLGTAAVPALKLNTKGYYGISGEKWYFAGNTAYDGHWRFSQADVVRRSPAFNPLAYNPAIQYLPWNENGTRFPDSFYGGSLDTTSGSQPEWDMRYLPPSMGGGTVRSKLVGTRTGWIPDAGMPRTLSTVPAGSVRYDRLTIGTTPEPPAGADLFSGTIWWDNPNCAAPSNADTYGWVCPGGTGTPFASPADPSCSSAAQVGNFSASRSCCTDLGTTPDTRVASYQSWFNASYPSGTPPAMTGPAGEVCSITYQGSRSVDKIPQNCTTTVQPCGGGGGELCTVKTCEQVPEYLWRCTFNEAYNRQICNVATTGQQCVVTGNVPTCPSGNAPLDDASDARYRGGYWTPARYAVYDGPQPGSSADRLNLSNYRMVMVDRKFGWNGASRDLIGNNLSDAVSKWFVVDGVTGMPAYRPDCAVLGGQDGTWCTFEQEAQNYANWFTYYRSRLFAAIGVVSEVLSNFNGPEQFMRVGYGSINYFPGALNPWNVGSLTDIPYPVSLPSADSDYGGAVVNEGGVVRGVRPFTVYDPPASFTPNPKRAEVFKWLFSINGLGPTPNRETIHAAGLYFARQDSKGPWGEFPGQGAEPSTDHLWCRRNYTVLATDGEWTRLPTDFGFTPQRLLERAGDFSTLDKLNFGSVTNSLSTTGPDIVGSDRLTNVQRDYTYVPASEPHMSGGSGSVQTNTLSDVMHYYWSRDLRPEAHMRNSLTDTPTNPAFWQHMSTYVVGYGVSASMDDPNVVPSTRVSYAAKQAIAWPTVGLEDCRQLDNNAADAAIPNRPPCTLTAFPSGNRINDTMRGGLVSGGDFFSAQSPAALKSALDSVFAAINSDPASGTAPGLSSSSVGAGNIIIQSGFQTNTWEGSVDAWDQVALLNYLKFGGVKPATVWTANFPAPGSRKLYTTTGMNTPVTFEWGSLTDPQKTLLDVASLAKASSPVLDYLRGDATLEIRNGGTLRSRFKTILGDIVNSSPLYSKATDFAYQLRPAASKTLPVASTQGADVYRSYVSAKQTTRHEVVLVGSNGGFLHVLDARTGQATSGQELFGFVPRALFANLRELSLPAYAHRYYVDGPTVEGDVWNGSAWQTIAVGSTGAGKAGLYALDITKPELGFSSANVLWDVVPAEHANPDVQDHLGNVLQAGVIASVKDKGAPNGAGRWVYIVGNGYESVRNEATLLVFDAFTGALIKAIKTGDGDAANPNGIGAITPVYDGSRNVIAVFGGDRRGNLWKFDLSSDTPNDPDGGGPLKGWMIYNNDGSNDKPLFEARDQLNVRQPITAAPRITPHPLGGVYVAFGTGKMFETGDPADTQVQSLYVVWDQGQVAPITKAQLQPIALQEFLADDDLDPATPNEKFRNLKAADLANYDWNDKGFYIPLIAEGGPTEGERLLAAPILDAGVLSLTTFAPTTGTDRCIPGGVSYLYRLNLAGGLSQSGFLNVSGAVARRIQPGLVSSAPPLHEPVPPGGVTVDSMTVDDVKTMMQNPKYSMSAGRAVSNSAGGTCAHVGLRVDGTVARIPTACAGLLPMRTWRPVR